MQLLWQDAKFRPTSEQQLWPWPLPAGPMTLPTPECIGTFHRSIMSYTLVISAANTAPAWTCLCSTEQQLLFLFPFQVQSKNMRKHVFYKFRFPLSLFTCLFSIFLIADRATFTVRGDQSVFVRKVKVILKILLFLFSECEDPDVPRASEPRVQKKRKKKKHD